MKHKTYTLLKEAYLGHVSSDDLWRQVLSQENDPFVHQAAQLITHPPQPLKVPWHMENYTSDFQKASPQQRLTETVMTFILRLVTIIKEETHMRTFRKPESYVAIQAWILLLKQVLYVTFTLLYNVRWTVELLFEMDYLIFVLLYEGNIDPLRSFMVNTLHIPATETITPAEQLHEKLNFLTTGQFGSSFWRYLHWMAEAMDLREATDHPDIALAKQMWREIITHPLYRMLRCGICMHHLKAIVEELKPQFLDPTTRYRTLWFNIHNKVTANQIETHLYYAAQSDKSPPIMELETYTESQLEEDAKFMLQALVP